MKQAILNKRTFGGYALLILQIFLIFFLSLINLSDQYYSTWNNYLNDQTSYTLYLNQVSSKQSDEVLSYLDQTAQEENFLILRKGSRDTTFNLGVAGSSQKVNGKLKFYNQTLNTDSNLNKLLHSSNPNATIGKGNGSINQIATTPGFWFAPNINIYKLSNLIKKEHTLNGSYKLVGLQDKDVYKAIINRLHTMTGIEKSNFTAPLGGESSTGNLLKDSIIVGIILTAIGLLVFFLILFLNKLREYGTLILLGWSKLDIFVQTIKPYLLFLIIFEILLLVFSIIFNITFINAFILMNIKVLFKSLALFVILFTLAASLILISKNVALIKGQYPKKLIYTFFSGFYMLLMAATVGICLYIDQPAQSIVQTAQQAQQWQKVSKFSVLSSMSGGNDGVRSYSDTSSNINRDFYNLYKK